MLSLSSILALFTLLAIASGVFFASKKIKIPYTVLLVLVGIILVPVVKLPAIEPVFGFLDDLVLTPELLFYIFLPTLLFESAFNINIRKMIESVWSISLLSIVGLITSTIIIAAALYTVMPWIGMPVPFIVTLLFGAIISATDPVAVLALFKEYGAPKRLSLIFEGESLFNDGTAVALFLVILAAAQNGFHGQETILEGLFMFMSMVIGGIIFGVIMAIIFSRALRYTKSNEFVSVTLLVISAHLVFIVSELINQSPIFGIHIHLSPIIATTIAALFFGNYTRHILSPHTDDYLEKSISHLAFTANSLVFLLAGILFASTQVDLSRLWLPILVTIFIVMVARIISVYVVTSPINLLKVESPIPRSWQVLLAWGSLRGALAIIIVMLIPEDFSVPGWAYAFSPRDFILALTIGCILATLFLKAPTIGPLLRRLKLDKSPPLDLAHEADLGIYYLLTEQSRFEIQKTKGFVKDAEYKLLRKKLLDKCEDAYVIRNMLLKEHGQKLFEQSLRLTAIDIENHFLKQLYINDEVSEPVYRAIRGKLTLQKEKIEHAQHDDINLSAYRDRKDVFDALVSFMQTVFERKSEQDSLEYQLQYYRGQMIIARKALKTLDEMQHQYDSPIFMPPVYDKVISLYDKFKTQSAEKMDKVLAEHPEELSGYVSQLAEKSVRASGVRAIEFLSSRGIANESNVQDIKDRYAL